MKELNTPPRQEELSDDDENIVNEEEVLYEIENEEDLIALEEQFNNEQHEDDMEYDEGVVNEATLIYTNHKDSVFCVAYSPDSELVATGGEDDKAYIWSATSGETKLECSGHEDSVTCVSFSHDGVYLATADLKGHVQAWKISTLSKVWEFETNEDLNFMLWHSSSNILFAGTSEGSVWMWLIPQGNTKSLSHSGVSAECGSIMKDGKRMCVGYMNGAIKIIDMKSCQTLHTFQAHSEQVTCLALHQDNNLMMSGGIDGYAVVTNTFSGKEIAKFNCAFQNVQVEDEMESEYNNTVEVVSFCPSMANFAITATLSGVITIWDISINTSRHHIVQGCGTSSICWYPHDPYFFTGGIDGKLRIYDARSGEQKGKCIGHNESILGCDINKENTRVVTCSDDSTTRIFSIEQFVS